MYDWYMQIGTEWKFQEGRMFSLTVLHIREWFTIYLLIDRFIIIDFGLD